MNEQRLSLPDHFGPYCISPFPKGPLRAARASSWMSEKTYYFCTLAHKAEFDRKPEQFLVSEAG